MSLSAKEVNELKLAPTIDGVLPIFHHRWSSRFFADRDVAPETLAKLFEAARWAASSNNEQPWRFIVGLRGSETHAKLAESLAGFNQAWAPKAPVLILGTALDHFTHGARLNRFALYDLGAAASHLTLQAAALGLTTHQMGGFDQDKARAAFNIPADHILGAVIALGYQGDPTGTPEDELLKRELVPRTRKPLTDFVFESWGEPAKLG